MTSNDLESRAWGPVFGRSLITTYDHTVWSRAIKFRMVIHVEIGMFLGATIPITQE